MRLNDEYGTQGIHAWSVQPGAVQTDLARHMPDDGKNVLASDPYPAKVSKNPEQGAATSACGATAAALESMGGKYLENCQIAGPWKPSLGHWGPGRCICQKVDHREVSWRANLFGPGALSGTFQHEQASL
ncbi:uncharacterized protein NECHADRAFT_89051 [Fusarium vanettenii 77-13-4]|uniref:Uncharacterized protein n=1 Tax=Fusarium vanettenii (strain ATCC MYA-4622 / CBS 123669 / FGSC 9596 / NRRL 45880 / 77-13-4) TaxID=660122 RepID=C7ZQ05_FUSV7|nr:uncharacterized protein NECHADRAFT_89051 [Fusarium vanettenii 77-13-4]EEU33901.1 hypothetical protein NECHADRAFT_89051 [Fusarium vanettenii 77-13-4]